MKRLLLPAILVLTSSLGCSTINPDVSGYVRDSLPGLQVPNDRDCICAILCWASGGLPCDISIATLCGFVEFPGCFNGVNSLERVDETTGKELTQNL